MSKKEKGPLRALEQEILEVQEAARKCYESLHKKDSEVAELERLRHKNETEIAKLKEENIFFRRQAIVDGLTGIYNRRYFEEEFRKEFWKSKRLQSELLSLVIIDIDYFKQFNDTYGHPKGDEVLQQVSLEFSLIVKRPGDSVARYGGEEFVFLLPNTNQAGAEHLAEETRARIERLAIHHKENKASSSGVVTISLGVATLNFKEASPDELLKRADDNLYKAKTCGRNRVYSQSSDEF